MSVQYSASFRKIGMLVVILTVGVLLCACVASAQELQISVGITETQTGPDICINGQGFTPNGLVETLYWNIPPAFPTPVRVGPEARAVGHAVHLRDTSMDRGPAPTCNQEQIDNAVVTVVAVDKQTGRQVAVNVPTRYWCINALTGTDHNGGCH